VPSCFQDLLLLEEQEGSVNFKFGVLYTRPGQTTDDEMFSNGEYSYRLWRLQSGSVRQIISTSSQAILINLPSVFVDKFK
jgi:hypothetical protein